MMWPCGVACYPQNRLEFSSLGDDTDLGWHKVVVHNAKRVHHFEPLTPQPARSCRLLAEGVINYAVGKRAFLIRRTANVLTVNRGVSTLSAATTVAGVNGLAPG